MARNSKRLAEKEKIQHVAKSAEADKLRKMVKDLREKLVKKDKENAEISIKSAKEVEETIKEDRKAAIVSRNRMLDAQKMLREQQEKTEGIPKPWRVCEVCLEEYNDKDRNPKVLPCGHTFCMECTQKLCEYNSIRCPIDRKNNKILKINIINLPTNFAVLHM